MAGGGGGAGGADTVMENGASDADWLPSLTVIVMLLKVPTFVAAGVPVNAPVDELNVAHAGRLVTVNVSVEVVGPVAFGVNAYGWFAGVMVPGVPEMLNPGAELGWVTVIAKGLRAALRPPSFAAITMFG